MKNKIFCWVMGLSLLTIAALVFAHEKTGWMAPEEAKKMKNPIKTDKSLNPKRKGDLRKEVCPLPRRQRGWKRSHISGIKSKTNKFQRVSWRNDD